MVLLPGGSGEWWSVGVGVTALVVVLGGRGSDTF